jgi:hypothetical protein
MKETDDPDGPVATELRELLRDTDLRLESVSYDVEAALHQEWDQGKARRAVAGLTQLLGHLQGAIPSDPAASGSE